MVPEGLAQSGKDPTDANLRLRGGSQQLADSVRREENGHMANTCQQCATAQSKISDPTLTNTLPVLLII